MHRQGEVSVEDAQGTGVEMPQPIYSAEGVQDGTTGSASQVYVEEPLFGEKFNAEEERLLDSKYEDSWTPTFMNNDPKWRLVTRIVIILVAVAMLWLTSLKVATSIAALYVATPTYAVVADQWLFVARLSENERVASQSCVERQLQQCHTRLDKKTLEEQTNAANKGAHNIIKLQLRDLLRVGCLNAHYNSLGAVGKLLDAASLDAALQVQLNGLYEDACSEDEQKRLLKLMSDGSKQKSEIYGQNVEFANEAGSSLDRVRFAIDQRVAYDQSYAYNKTKALWEAKLVLQGVIIGELANIRLAVNGLDPQLDRMRLCMQPNPPPGLADPPCPVNATALYDAMRKNLLLQVSAFNRSIYIDYIEPMKAYIAHMSAYGQAGLAFLAEINKRIDDLKSLGIDLTNNFPGYDTLMIGPIDFVGPDLNVGWPAPPPVPTVDATFPRIDLNPMYDDMKRGLTDAVNDVSDSLETATDKLNDVISLLDNPFSDYDPPQINLTIREEQKNLSAKSDSYLSRARTSLGEFDSSGAMFNNTGNTSFFKNFSRSGFQASAAAFLHEGYKKSVDFLPLTFLLFRLNLLFINADLVYRLLHTFMIIFKYMAMSEVGLPVVDVRKFRASKKRNYQMIAMKSLTHPYCFVAFAAFLLALFLLACAVVYVPMYISYYEACVTEHDPTGTFVTNTSYSFAYNWAAQDYNKNLADGVSQYDERRNSDCSVNTRDSEANYSATLSLSVSIEERLFKMSQDMALFNKCIKPLSVVDSEIVRLNISKVGPFNEKEIEARGLCVNLNPNDMPTFEDSRFNCSHLPICNMTCAGPDRKALVAATKESGCTSEWMFHAGMFRFVLALLVYVCLNISRTLVMMAVIRLTWRVLAGKGFEYLGTVDRLGRMDEGAKVRLKTQVDIDIRRYERFAWLLLLLAILVHIPYIYVLQKYGHVIAST
eukprot:gb/GEZN01001495.1/.p1 GENE.gb/GEZN01001495.1/~~gb/GEZN01001495.1/.p1  ORF type:complete len:936 (+),score=147.05 gb/GEZN01001495.1/:3-2810(+)